MQSVPRSGWHCQCRGHAGGPCRMPPAPQVMAALYMEYKRKAKPNVTFAQYLTAIGFTDPSVGRSGMDDNVLAVPVAGSAELELLSIPTQQVQGALQAIVLMVDFSDRPGVRDADHYRDLLFSKGTHPTGSMRDYYAEVSRDKVDVTGTVHGWLRMPEPYSHYVGGGSGTDAPYPNNCQRLAEDAVKAALAQGVQFPPELDKLGRSVITALFIVHSGQGAEYQPTVPQQKSEIWSHKWTLRTPVKVAPELSATTYLVVPQNCTLGVCAHELGHLAFQWQDFYDPNYDDDGTHWDGSGSWDLMASGSHNHGGATPAHPAALHKSQHGWVTMQTVTASGPVTLKPIASPGGRTIKIVSNVYKPTQFLLLENRVARGFDRHLPGQGLLVWRVDTEMEQFAPATPGMQLVQADGMQNLETVEGRLDFNEGDDGDPFPGSAEVTGLDDQPGGFSTTFPTGQRSGVRLSNIRVDSNGVIRLDVTISPAVQAVAPAKTIAVAAAPLKLRGQLKPDIETVTDERLTLSGVLGKAARKAKVSPDTAPAIKEEAGKHPPVR